MLMWVFLLFLKGVTYCLLLFQKYTHSDNVDDLQECLVDYVAHIHNIINFMFIYWLTLCRLYDVQAPRIPLIEKFENNACHDCFTEQLTASRYVFMIGHHLITRPQLWNRCGCDITPIRSNNVNNLGHIVSLFVWRFIATCHSVSAVM